MIQLTVDSLTQCSMFEQVLVALEQGNAALVLGTITHTSTYNGCGSHFLQPRTMQQLTIIRMWLHMYVCAALQHG